MINYLIIIGLTAIIIFGYMRQEKAKRRNGVYLNIKSIHSDKTIRIEQYFKKRVLLIFFSALFIGVPLFFPNMADLYRGSFGDSDRFIIFVGFFLLLILLIVGLPMTVVLKALWRSGAIYLEKETLTLASPLKMRTISLSEINDLFIFHHIYSTKYGRKEENRLVIWLKSGTKLEKELDKESLEKCGEMVRTLYENSENKVQAPEIVHCIMR